MVRSQMRKSVATFGGLALLALVGSGPLAAGCGKSNPDYYCDSTGCFRCDGYGCTPITPPTPAPCNGSTLCGENEICTTAGCTLQCSADSQCPEGDVCKSGLCTPPAQDAGTPVAACGGANGGPCSCTTDQECSGGDVCVGGLCAAPSSVCQYTSQCQTNGSTDVCDNGQCVPSCTSSTNCPANYTCTKGVCVVSAPQCTSNTGCSATAPYCIAGTCAAACTSDSQCPAGDYCDDGACILDTRAKPNCATDAQCNISDAGPARLCISGFCKYECTSAAQCELIDNLLKVCGPKQVCWTPNEANPQCTDASQCKAGQDCISNTCQ